MAETDPLAVIHDGNIYRCGPNIGRKYKDGARLVIALGYEYGPDIPTTLQEHTLTEVQQLLALIRELEQVAPESIPKP